MPETTTFTPDKLFAGAFPERLTAACTVLSGENLSQFEIVESDLVGKIIPHSGINEADDTAQPIVAGVMVEATDATIGDVDSILYESGFFHDDVLIWPVDCTTDLLKRKLLEGSLIKVSFQDVGEV